MDVPALHIFARQRGEPPLSGVRGLRAEAADRRMLDELLTLNMVNGAHHTDLSHSLPGPEDTPDVVAARANATVILTRWLQV